MTYEFSRAGYSRASVTTMCSLLGVSFTVNFCSVNIQQDAPNKTLAQAWLCIGAPEARAIPLPWHVHRARPLGTTAFNLAEQSERTVLTVVRAFLSHFGKCMAQIKYDRFAFHTTHSLPHPFLCSFSHPS